MKTGPKLKVPAPEGFHCCTKCKQVLPHDAFHKSSHYISGLKNRCKNCCKEMNDNWKARYLNGEIQHKIPTHKICKGCKVEFLNTSDNFYTRLGGALTDGKCKKCRMAADYAIVKRKKLINPDHFKLTQRKSCIKSAYGLSLEDYDNMFKKQNGVCAIYDQPETKLFRNGKLTNLSIDHCHETGVVRGLLCHACNTALGTFKDSIDLLDKAKWYVSLH